MGMVKKVLIFLAVALPMWLLVTLPASLVLSDKSAGLQLDQIQGTVWSGQARLVLPAQSPIPLQWRWTGGLAWDWALRSEGLQINGQWRITKRHRLSDITGWVDIQKLDIASWLVVIWPKGQMSLDVDFVEWSSELPRQLLAEGLLVWQQAALEGLVNESLGDIRISLSPSDEVFGQTRAVISSNAEGAVRISGNITSDGDRYLAELFLAPEPGRDRLLRYLAPLGRLQDGAIRIERSGQWGVFQ